MVCIINSRYPTKWNREYLSKTGVVQNETNAFAAGESPMKNLSVHLCVCVHV